MSETKPHTPAPKETVRLRVAGVHRTSFTIPLSGSDTLVIDTTGVEVPAVDVSRIISLAAQHGVTITEASN